MFNLFCDIAGMDLSFARRKTFEAARPSPAQALSGLLAEVASQQATTPTARAEIEAAAAGNPAFSIHSGVATLAARDAGEAAKAGAASFNPDVAAAIITQRKPF